MHNESDAGKQEKEKKEANEDKADTQSEEDKAEGNTPDKTQCKVNDSKTRKHIDKLAG